MIAAPVQRDVDGIAKGSHDVVLSDAFRYDPRMVIAGSIRAARSAGIQHAPIPIAAIMHRYADERGRVVRRDAEEQSPNDAGGEEGAGNAEHEADRQQHAAFPQDHPLHPTAVGAEAHADADLVGARADREGQHAGDPHRRDDHRQDAEQRDQRGIQASRRHTLILDLRHGHHVLDRSRRGDAPDDARRRGRQPRDVAVGADHQAAADRQLLRERHEHHRSRRRVQPAVLRIADDTDDRCASRR